MNERTLLLSGSIEVVTFKPMAKTELKDKTRGIKKTMREQRFDMKTKS